MALNIPMPALSGDAFTKGVNTGSSMFARIMHPIVQREQLAQQKKAHEESLALQKANAARAAALDPLRKQMLEMQLQKLGMEVDPAKKTDYINQLIQGLGGFGDQQGQQAQPETPADEMPSNIPSIGGMAEQYNMDAFNPQAMPHLNEQASSGYQAPSQQSVQQGFENLTPEQRMKFEMAGIKIPKPYETPEQKRIAENKNKIKFEEDKAKLKKIQEIKDTAAALMPYAGNVETIEDILKRKPQLTGRVTQLADALGMTRDEDVGTFISAAQNLQSKMAKDMSSRGGYGVAKLVEQGKPNIGKSTAFNKGVVSEIKKHMKDSFDQLNKEHIRLTGEKLPYDFEHFYKNNAPSNVSGTNKRLKFNPATGRLE